MRRLTTREFIQKAHINHGDKYNYSQVNYINANTRINIICPIHGEFQQLPSNHLTSNGYKLIRIPYEEELNQILL